MAALPGSALGGDEPAAHAARAEPAGLHSAALLAGDAPMLGEADGSPLSTPQLSELPGLLSVAADAPAATADETAAAAAATAAAAAATAAVAVIPGAHPVCVCVCVRGVFCLSVCVYVWLSGVGVRPPCTCSAM